MKININKLLKQILGMLLYSFGVAAIVFSSLGSSPIDAATYFMNDLIPFFDELIPGMPGIGIWLIIFNILIALLLVFLNKQYSIWKNIIVSIVIGLTVNLAIFIYRNIFNVSDLLTDNHNIFLKILVSFFGINFMSFGIAYLAHNNLEATPFDELALYLEKTIKKYYISKIILDGSFLLIALLLGFISGDPLIQIGWFTIVVLALLGPFINMYINLLTKITKKERSI